MSYNKYRVARKEDRTLDGIVFASKKEMNRYAELKLCLDCGIISELAMQPSFELTVCEKHCGTYRADFSYYIVAESKHVVEDVKGVRTALYKLKKKLVEAIYNIEIIEV